MPPLFEMRGRDGGEPLQDLQRYLQGLSIAVQGKGITAGLRAYIGAVRKQAQSDAPGFGPFGTSEGYRWAVRQTNSGGVTGYLYSSGYGNIIEAGSASHWAAIEDKISNGGAVTPGLGHWLRKYHPELLGKTARFMKTKARTGSPWVIPAGERASDRAAEQFETALINVIQKEVG